MSEAGFHIRKLDQGDNVQNFKLGNEAFLPLKTFLQKQAKTFQESNIAQTYAAVTTQNAIAGFIDMQRDRSSEPLCYFRLRSCE
jgi:hypothetical protein